MQAPSWSEYACCPVCKRSYGEERLPSSLLCGHSLCSQCKKHLKRGVCPLDMTDLQMDVAKIPVNMALQAVALRDTDPSEFARPSSFGERVDTLIHGEEQNLRKCVDANDFESFRVACKNLGRVAEHLHPADARAVSSGSTNGGSNTPPPMQTRAYWPKLSRPMHKKLAALLQSQMVHKEGRQRLMKYSRSVGERACMEILLLHQNQQGLVNDLWQAVRACGGQFMGHVLQEQILQAIFLLTSDPRHALQRKILVEFVLQRLAKEFDAVSKTNVGHVVQLMYRASCFHVTKRNGEEVSQLTLREDIQNYSDFRARHDMQIAQIAMEKGLYITPEYFSYLLYGSSSKRAHMQSIMDKLITMEYFKDSIEKVVLVAASQDTEEASRIGQLRPKFDVLESITRRKDGDIGMEEVGQVLDSVACVLTELVRHPKYKGWIEQIRHKTKGSTKVGKTQAISSRSAAPMDDLLPRGGGGRSRDPARSTPAEHQSHPPPSSRPAEQASGRLSSGPRGTDLHVLDSQPQYYQQHQQQQQPHSDFSQLVARGAGPHVASAHAAYGAGTQPSHPSSNAMPSHTSSRFRHAPPSNGMHMPQPPPPPSHIHMHHHPEQTNSASGGTGSAVMQHHQQAPAAPQAMHGMTLMSDPASHAHMNYSQQYQQRPPPRHPAQNVVPGTLWQPDLVDPNHIQVGMNSSAQPHVQYQAQAEPASAMPARHMVYAATHQHHQPRQQYQLQAGYTSSDYEARMGSQFSDGGAPNVSAPNSMMPGSQHPAHHQQQMSSAPHAMGQQAGQFWSPSHAAAAAAAPHSDTDPVSGIRYLRLE